MKKHVNYRNETEDGRQSAPGSGEADRERQSCANWESLGARELHRRGWGRVWGMVMVAAAAAIVMGWGLPVIPGAGIPGAEAAVRYTVTDLGTLGGDGAEGSRGFDINNLGQVVGYALNEAGEERAFLYSDGVMIDLGTLGGATSRAAGINDAGQVVGYAENAAGELKAFIYENGVMRELETLGGTSSYASDINALGWITGSAKTVEGELHTFLYHDGIVEDLGNMGGVRSGGAAVNNAGQVAGSYRNADGDFRAFLWTDGEVVDIGTLGGERSVAYAMNDYGEVTGLSSRNINGIGYGFLYGNGELIDIGTLGSGGTEPWGINNDGEIVGKSSGEDGTPHAFLYSQGSMIDLNTLIDPESEWLLYNGDDINDRGEIICLAVNQKSGYPFGPDVIGHVVLLTPAPEPCTMVLLGFAGAMIIGKRRKGVKNSRAMTIISLFCVISAAISDNAIGGIYPEGDVTPFSLPSYATTKVGNEGGLPPNDMGSVVVNDGAAVYPGITHIGYGVSGNGLVQVYGSNGGGQSQWHCRNISLVRQNMYVGYDGEGKLEIFDGTLLGDPGCGIVTNAIGYIGYGAGSVGEVEVSGADSLWDCSSTLYVGYNGTGTMTISEGAEAQSSGAKYIGYNAGSSGEVTISGAGSAWTSAGERGEEALWM